MAKEMILIPKLKYEHLRRLQNDEEYIQNDISNHEDQKTKDNPINVCKHPQEMNSSTGNEMHDLQSGDAYVSKIKTVAGPPGVSRTK